MVKYLDYDGLQEFKNQLDSSLDNKVDKIIGKGLSTNDFTTDLKNKLDNIEAGATANEGTVTGITIGQIDYIPINGQVTLPNYPTIFGASGTNHSSGLVPDPGSELGTSKYLREDGTWQIPSNGTCSTKIYLELNSGSLTSAMLTSQNVVYVISYDYTIADSVTVPANCTFEFAGGSINGGTLVLNNTYLYGNVKFGTGITVSGTCRNDTAYQKWFSGNNVDAWHTCINNVDGPSCYEYEFGEYTSTVRVHKEVDNGKVININGNNAILKYAYAANEIAYNVLSKNAETFTSSNITSAVSKGDRTISVEDGSSFHVGDIVSIRDNTDFSFSPFKANYKQCEFATIVGVSGNTLTLAHPVYGQYVNLSGSSKVYGFNHISCYIDNLAIEVTDQSAVSGKFAGLEIDQSVGGSLNNVRVKGFRTCIRVLYCSNFTVENCAAYVTTNQTTDDSYALSIGSCQVLNVIGGDYMGGNHAVMIGAGNSSISIMDREILVKNVRGNSIRDGFPNAIEMHGCSEFITIEGCTTAGMYVRGRNNNILNNFVYKNDISCGDLENYNHNIIGNILKDAKIIIAADEPASGGTFIQDSVEENFVIRNNKTFDCPNIPSSYTGTGTMKPAFRHFISANVLSTYYNIDNTKLIIEGNDVHNGVITASLFNTIIIRNNSFTYDSDVNSTVSSKPKLTCTKCFIEGNKFINYGHNVWYVGKGGSSPVEPGTKTWAYINLDASYLSVKDNYVESDTPDSALFEGDSTVTDLYVEGNIVKSKFMIIQKAITKAVIRNNTIEPTVHGVNISLNTSALIDKAFVFNNLVTDEKSIIVFATTTTYGRNVNMNTMVLQAPKLLSGATYTNLDTANNATNYEYEEINYTVNTVSSSGGSLSIDGTIPIHVITLTGNVSSLVLSANPTIGHVCHIMFTAANEYTVSIAHDNTNRICPNAEDILLTIPAGGYTEIDFLNANNKIYVRGI